MTEFEETLRRYTAARAARVTQSNADTVVARSASTGRMRRGPGRHLLNAGAALTLVLAVIAAGIVVQMHLHGLRSSGPATSGSGPLPPVPNEVIDLDNYSPDMILPFRLKDARMLAPRPRWALLGNRALLLALTSDCSTTTIRVVDRTTQQDTQLPVTLTDCFNTPVILPGTSVLLAHYDFKNGNPSQYQGLGMVRYDWSAGRITKSYPALSPSFSGGGLISADGLLLYTDNPFASGSALDFTDLRSGIRIAHIPMTFSDAQLNAGGLALSPDGRTLYVNQGDRLATFDAISGTPGAVLPFTGGQKSTSSALPWWLPSVISADAKEGFEPGHGIAVDPGGRWVVALGGYYDTAGLEDLWLFSTSGSSIQLVRRIDSSSGFGGVAFSRDGSVLYALEFQSYLDVIDPQTGREIKHLRAQGVVGIEGVEVR